MLCGEKRYLFSHKTFPASPWVTSPECQFRPHRPSLDPARLADGNTRLSEHGRFGLFSRSEGLLVHNMFPHPYPAPKSWYLECARDNKISPNSWFQASVVVTERHTVFDVMNWSVTGPLGTWPSYLSHVRPSHTDGPKGAIF